MCQGIPCKVFTDGQNQCSSRKDFELPASINESIPEPWERLQEYILACPHHGMDNWLILQTLYNRMTQSSCDHVDAAVGGAFFSRTIEIATALIKKVVSNQGWSDDRLQPRHRGMNFVKEADMLKKFEDYSQDKAQIQTL
jgi:hypothetical protein